MIKRMRIRIKIQNKFYMRLNGEIEKKNQFSKRKKIKRIRIKIDIKIKIKIKIKF
jgi:hypothetical protein